MACQQSLALKHPKQEVRLLIYLRRVGSINQREAIVSLGIYRLAAVVHRLRQAGFNITSIQTFGINRFGERVRYSTYQLLERVAA